jgi:hypothetical protein
VCDVFAARSAENPPLDDQDINKGVLMLRRTAGSCPGQINFFRGDAGRWGATNAP